jgi:Autotransporter beta-domain
MGRWLRSVLLGSTTGLAFIHAAAAAERIHIDFNGYLPAANRYCISARSVQGDPQAGFLWRFTVGGGPSAPVGITNFVNLNNTTSTNLFPSSIADHEKFRVYQTPFGPILGDKASSNELNAFRDQTCETAGGGGGGGGAIVLPPPGGGGGGGGGAVTLPAIVLPNGVVTLPSIVLPGGGAVTLPAIVPGGGGGAVTLPAIVLPNGAVVLPGIVPPGGSGGGGAITLPAIVLPGGVVVLPALVPPGGGAVTLPAILPGGGATTLPAIVLPDGTVKFPDGTIVPPSSGGGTVTSPAFVPGGGGGDGGTGGGGGGGPVDNSVFHRQLARLLGTEFAARPDLIADALQCGLQQKSGTADGITFAPMGPKWCAWTSPRQVNYKDTRNGVKFAGTLRDIAFGLDYRVTPDLVVGLAVTAQDAAVSLEGLEVSLRQSGIGAGPYLGWRIRPTTIFDVWVAYTHLDRSFDIIGITASAPVDRTTITANLTEFITTPWMRIIPRLTYFQQQDRAQGFTTNTGFTVVGSPYDYSFMEAR